MTQLLAISGAALAAFGISGFLTLHFLEWDYPFMEKVAVFCACAGAALLVSAILTMP